MMLSSAMPDVIDLSTIAGLLRRNYSLGCYCPGCRRWATCYLAMLVRNGLGDRRITECKPVCRKCGQRGEWRVRPPPYRPDAAERL